MTSAAWATVGHFCTSSGASSPSHPAFSRWPFSPPSFTSISASLSWSTGAPWRSGWCTAALTFACPSGRRCSLTWWSELSTSSAGLTWRRAGRATGWWHITWWCWPRTASWQGCGESLQEHLLKSWVNKYLHLSLFSGKYIFPVC